MHALRIHTDFPQPLHTTFASSDNPNNLKPAELRGVAHLFRELSHTPTGNTLSNPSARTTLLFVVAVPNYFSPDDFLLFCVSYLPNFTEVLFIRNDGVEDRYSVLIRLENQFSATGFYYSFNGKKFKPSEVEVCHMYFVQSVQYTMSAEIATTPPEFAELPTCPVCLERLNYDTSGITSTLCDHSFQCSCVSKWTYLSCLVCRLCQQQDEKLSCAVCGILNNLWVCLICGFVGCSRYENGHAIGHWSDKQHRFSLQVGQQQIWDYVGKRYVHRLNQSKVGVKSVMINSHCNSVGECGTCVCDGGAELDGALFNSKVEAIVDEYNHLLASQLEIQRKHYESLLTEAKSRKESSIAKAAGKAIFSRTHDLQDKSQDKLGSYEEEKKAVADRNQELMKKQELMQKKFKAIEERERETLNSREEKVIDLQEQIRDLKIYVEAQRTVANMNDSDSIKGGTVLPVDSNQSSSGNRKRQTKPGRRHK
ncbi:zinc finger (ubiquitin-hydrolase) domain-containing protein [Abeliophyllum distichum]|uniref:Zinc finger (Ubiquitin-hydrolase) domain-containing protein n=1 Tax=Abeliophyllum distichum TaxID=126358 RepID=A0ABD1QUQ0_9LAMI